MKRGFTLLELLLVLAIIVIVVAASAPSISRWAAQREVLEAARTIRGKLFKARLGAMHSNHAYAFEYEVGSGSYRLSPEEQLGQAGGSDKDKSSSDRIGLTDDSPPPPPEEGSLPSNMRFMADNKSDTETDSQSESQSAESNGWSDPIMFYPDGTTSDAKFKVVSGRGYEVQVRLRGVTGNVVTGLATRSSE